MGNADLSLYHKTIEYTKGNEGLEYTPYEDKNSNWEEKPWLVCYGNMFDGNKLINRKKVYTHSECEKLIYNHFFKKVFPRVDKKYKANQFMAVADMKYQYGEYAKVTEKRLKSFPNRKRWEKFKTIIKDY